jgi:hypothetical protein
MQPNPTQKNNSASPSSSKKQATLNPKLSNLSINQSHNITKLYAFLEELV